MTLLPVSEVKRLKAGVRMHSANGSSEFRKKRDRQTIIYLIILVTGFLIFFSTSVPRFQVRIAPSLQFAAKIMKSGDSSGGVPVAMKYDMRKIEATAHPMENKERVLLLSPIHLFRKEYWQNLLNLSYPHGLIELGFVVPKHMPNLEELLEAAQAVQVGPEHLRFSDINILIQDEPLLHDGSEKARHALNVQYERRRALAIARNTLWTNTLKPYTSWVFWLDSDIIETPPNIIQDLASLNVAIVAPNVFQRYVDDNHTPQIRPYDFNNWRDSDTAQNLMQDMQPDEIILEGYAEYPTYRSLMGYDYNPQDPNKFTSLELDGVGGAALLVKAEVHRDGAMFPPFAFYHLIESEGFAKMCSRLNYKILGLPNYLVFHYNE